MGFRYGNVGIDPYYDARAKIRGDERDARVARVEKAKENAASRITDYEPTDINWKSGYDPEGFQRLYDIERIKQGQDQQQVNIARMYLQHQRIFGLHGFLEREIL